MLLADDGTVNLSPKGLTGSFAVLDDFTVAYLDFAGSNAETIAHLRENGRITLMWCAFDGPPNIVRIHGLGEPVFRDDSRWPELMEYFPNIATSRHGLRAIIVVHAELIRDTCGYAVPFMTYDGDRDLHSRRFAREDDESPTWRRERFDEIVAADGINGVTRERMLEVLASTDDFNADGWMGDVGKDLRGFSDCQVILQVQDGEFARVFPGKPG